MFRTWSALLGAGFLAAVLAAGCGGGGGGGTNHAPTADGQVVATSADTPVEIVLTGNDPDGDALTYVIDSQPQHGTLDVANQPTVSYTPDSGFTGVDSFTFYATDGALDSDIATVLIGVDNAAPTTSGLTDSTPEDTPLLITLPGSDANGDALSWVIDVQPSHGTLDLAALPAVTYLSDADYNGNDSFSFHVTDQVASSVSATVDITVTPVNDAPVADDRSAFTLVDTAVSITLTASDVENDALSWIIDAQPEHGMLTGTAPDLVYVPGAGYEGVDNFIFHVDDGQLGSNAATVSVQILLRPIWGWGDNGYGQLASTQVSERHAPGIVDSISKVETIGAGFLHSITLKMDGTVWAWGGNNRGQLGDGTTIQRRTPVQVQGLTDIVAVSTASGHCLALKSDGGVWAWGSNSDGRLGDGTTDDRHSPVQVQGLSNVMAINAGWSHSLALKIDGTVWAWGYNQFGRLGDGTTVDRPTPVQVLGGATGDVFLQDVAAISAGGAHSLALRTDGAVWIWGSGGDYTPVRVEGLTDVVGIEAGWWHSLALDSNGTLWAWGYNGHGQLGIGTTESQFLPVQVLNDVAMVGSGDAHVVALKTDDSLWAWGYNGDGQLGDGTTDDRWAPVQVLGGDSGDEYLQRVVGIACGAYHSLAIRE